MGKLLRDPLYTFSLISRCIIHGLNTCLHFWFSDFLRTVIKEDKKKVILFYTFICFAGPSGGIITNTLLRPYIGNYESKKSSWPIVILQFIVNYKILK